jgi:hypothetical protein
MKNKTKEKSGDKPDKLENQTEGTWRNVDSAPAEITSPTRPVKTDRVEAPLLETKAVLSKSAWQEEIEKRKKKAKTLLMVNTGIFLFSLLLLIVFYYFMARPENNLISIVTTPQSEEIKKEEVEVEVELRERKIDGQMVPVGEEEAALVAVMIDNHIDARPHAGIASALLVFEAEVEGAATRLMAVFSDQQALPEIGPVRSARPYFIDWAHELGALYAHVGGSPDALVKIEQDRIPDINEFFNGRYFWRARDRNAPHNVFTSSENIASYIIDKEIKKTNLIAWSYKDDKPETERASSSSIRIDYRLASDKVEWRYDRASNYYLRYVAGKEYRDKDGQAVMAKNIAILVAEAHELDEKLRLEMDTIGSGEATICMDGTCQKGEWRKPSEAERTRFYGEDGKELSFNRGTTWIQAVRPGVSFEY